MKYIVYVIIGSMILSLGISHLIFKYADKNVPPSIVGIFLILIYIGVTTSFDKSDEE